MVNLNRKNGCFLNFYLFSNENNCFLSFLGLFAVINIFFHVFNFIRILIELNSERNLPLSKLNPQLNTSVYLSEYLDFI